MNFIWNIVVFIYFQLNLSQVVFSKICPYYPQYPILNPVKNASCSDQCCDKYASTESEACCEKTLVTNVTFYLSIIIPVSCLLVCIIGSIIYFWYLHTKNQTRDQISSESNLNNSSQTTDAPPLYKDLFKTRTSRISSIAKTYPSNLSMQIVDEQNSPPPPYRSQINTENQN